MSEKWTKGPWTWVNRGGYFVLVSKDGNTICDDGSAGDEYKREIDPEGDDTQKANSNLISAAPELYDALKELVAHCESHGIRLLSANAALRKARGE